MKYLLVILILACCAGRPVCAQQIFSYLYSYENAPLYGLADSAGNTLSAGMYNDVSPERNGAIRVSAGMRGTNDYSNARYGFLHSDGRLLCPVIYSKANNFSEGMALVGKTSGSTGFLGVTQKLGFIDKQGKEVIPCAYTNAEDFSEGLAAVSTGEKQWMYINKTGKVVIPGPFDRAMSFAEGLAAVYVPYTAHGVSSFKVGYVDQTGKLVIPPQYSYGRPFVNGRAIVQVRVTEPSYKSYAAIIDRQGKQLTQGEYIDIVTTGAGHTLVKLKGSAGLNQETDEWGVLDAAFKLLPERYTTPPYNLKGLMAYQDKASGLFGYKDVTGAIKIPPAYKVAQAFNEGLAPVVPANNTLFGFINLNNQLVIPPQFNYVGIFQNGLAIVSKPGANGKRFQGVIDKTGKVVVPFDDRDIIAYRPGKAHFRKSYIDYFDYGNGKTSLAADITTLAQTREAIAYIAKNNVQAANEKLVPLEAKNYGYANYWLGYLLLQAPAPFKNPARGAALMKNAAAWGVPQALHAMGYIYHTGVAGTRDYNLSLEWYRKAGAKGLADAYVQSGQIQEQGLAGTKDIPSAIKDYTQAAELFNAAGMYYLGLIYFNGNGVTVDKNKGRRWLQQAADLGLKEAKDFLVKTAKL